MRRRSRGGKGGKGEQKFKVSDFEDLYFTKKSFGRFLRHPFHPKASKQNKLKSMNNQKSFMGKQV
jgi:hypothetical protein